MWVKISIIFTPHSYIFYNSIYLLRAEANFIFGDLGYFKLGALLEGIGGRSHIFRLRLRSCFKTFESGVWTGSEKFSSLRIRLLFRLRLPSMQPNFTSVLPKKCHVWKPHRLLLLKTKSDSGSGSGFSQIFDSGAGSERKRHDLAGVDSGTPDP